MATISSSGTWSSLTTTLPARTEPNVPAYSDISMEDFRTPISEVAEFVQLVADGYSTNHNVAIAFLRHQLTSLANGQIPLAS